jgi:hypothetical protein
MFSTVRWIAFVLAVLLLIISPYLPPGVPGLIVVITALALWFKSVEQWLSIALGIIGLLGLLGILPIFCSLCLYPYSHDKRTGFFSNRRENY